MTCKLSLSSPFIIIRIKLFVARSVVRSVVYSCAALSRSIQKTKQPHTRFFCAFFERARPRIFFCKTAKTNEARRRIRGHQESKVSLSFFSPPKASSEPKLLPQERKRIKISSLFQKKKINFSLFVRSAQKSLT